MTEEIKREEKRLDEELLALRQELEDYRKEKEQIRQVIGAIGGADSQKRDRIFNIVFIGVLVLIFGLDILRHFFDLRIPKFTAMLSLEVGVLMISIKIIWMMHKQNKVEHFQFWILNSIEFRLNSVAKKVRSIERLLKK
ncbi:hypothetical protein P0136_03840 [Lentisphaerota bacterium ZTH]|nr:hypothetical protein JYG24_05040 [Lentisphaerota bacterium]WET07130.1 hypothetical protein P0136_03840 [Lentisphaerota bacterium ZTH]